MKNTIQNKYEFTILRPGGNDQMLIKGIIPKEQKRAINDEMIKRYPNVEQVSFYEYNIKKNFAILELAGGEFCGNATRSLAYLLLKGKRGELDIEVSGTSEKLKAGVKIKKTAFAQMPVKKKQSLKRINKKLFRIDLEGITHLVSLESTDTLSSNQLKSRALNILKKENLIYSIAAAGVMFIKEYKGFIELKPIVWVRDIETLLYETACASGTAAVGIYKTNENQKNSNKTKVLQPSGKFITAEVYKEKSTKVYIDGEIEVLQKGIEGI